MVKSVDQLDLMEVLLEHIEEKVDSLPKEYRCEIRQNIYHTPSGRECTFFYRFITLSFVPFLGLSISISAEDDDEQKSKWQTESFWSGPIQTITWDSYRDRFRCCLEDVFLSEDQDIGHICEIMLNQGWKRDLIPI